MCPYSSIFRVSHRQH